MDEDLLLAVVDRIVPADGDPGAIALGTGRYIVKWLQREQADGDLIVTGLEKLAPSFTALSPAERDTALEAIEGEAWFQRLVVLVSEGFYADPDNGGNDGARSWQMIGYRHRLPEGPSGPPDRARSS